MDERVAADPSLLIALVCREENFEVHHRQLADPGGRREIDDFILRAGPNLTVTADHFSAGQPV